MCRNIKPLFNFDPSATKEEIHEASLQFVRKISGYQRPSALNEKIFNEAVGDVSLVSKKLLNELKTNAPPRNREIESRKAHERAVKRFGIR